MTKKEHERFVESVMHASVGLRPGFTGYTQAAERVGRIIDTVYQIGKVAGITELTREIADGRQDDN